MGFGCDRDEEMEHDNFLNPTEVIPDSDYNAWATGTAFIHNPSEEDLNLVNLTRLISDDGRVYRIMGECFVPANGRTMVVIGTNHGHFDLAGGEILSIPGLSRYEQFFGVYVITGKNTDPMRNAFG